MQLEVDGPSDGNKQIIYAHSGGYNKNDNLCPQGGWEDGGERIFLFNAFLYSLNWNKIFKMNLAMFILMLVLRRKSRAQGTLFLKELPVRIGNRGSKRAFLVGYVSNKGR